MSVASARSSCRNRRSRQRPGLRAKKPPLVRPGPANAGRVFQSCAPVPSWRRSKIILLFPDAHPSAVCVPIVRLQGNDLFIITQGEFKITSRRLDFRPPHVIVRVLRVQSDGRSVIVERFVRISDCEFYARAAGISGGEIGIQFDGVTEVAPSRFSSPTDRPIFGWDPRLTGCPSLDQNKIARHATA